MKPMKRAAHHFVVLAGTLVLGLVLTGCAELQDQREHGSIMRAPEDGSIERMEKIDLAYIRNWLKARGTSPEGLVGKPAAEVQNILGRPKEKVTRAERCKPNPRRDAALLLHPEDRPAVEAFDKYWCQDDHMEWRYIVPRAFLTGFTSCQVLFEDGRVRTVGDGFTQF
jgi:hypothetical protein